MRRIQLHTSPVFIVAFSLIFFFVSLAFAQTSAKSDEGFSGMYTFLREGEFLQITVEDKGQVTGFVSRYGDSESDQGTFLDHFFKSGRLVGNQLTFATETVHGISYEFQGSIVRGPGKKQGDEGFYVLNGRLTESSNDDSKKTPARSREVSFKSFPQDLTR